MTAPLFEVTSHIDGKNAKVRIYPDRVEWEREKTVNKGLLVATMGMSAMAGPAGIYSRKGAGVEVIPMRSITSVTQKRDSMMNDVVSIITAGNTIDMRCAKAEAERLRTLILAGINGSLGSAPAAPTPAPQGPPAGWYPDQADPSKVRWWDGTRWTDHLQQR